MMGVFLYELKEEKNAMEFLRVQLRKLRDVLNGTQISSQQASQDKENLECELMPTTQERVECEHTMKNAIESVKEELSKLQRKLEEVQTYFLQDSYENYMLKRETLKIAKEKAQGDRLL